MSNDTAVLLLLAAVLSIVISTLYLYAQVFGRLKVEQNSNLMVFKLEAIKYFVLAALKKEALKLPDGDSLREWSEWITIDQNGSYHLDYRGEIESSAAIKKSAASDSVKELVDSALSLLEEMDQQHWIDNGHFNPFVNFVNRHQGVLVNHQEIIRSYHAIIACTTGQGVNDIKSGMINILLK